ncbi:hypothetical protein C8D72_0019 [Kushneria indalinina DSM 14324]|uniref:Uncharacterized protein n=2 Tax=Kushneria indalinina TaxID=184067 RepID=A0A3D9E0T0_9GAMM|nr:hypothetical protein C8D72_0019 [Kushneria indalinina DSM 14324]
MIRRVGLSDKHDRKVEAIGKRYRSLSETDIRAMALLAVKDFDTAIMRVSPQAAEDARIRYYAAIWTLNHGTLLGSFAEENAAGNYLQRLCAAAIGQIPHWGQYGQFEINVQGTPVKVTRTRAIEGPHSAFRFEALDTNAPFCVNTGVLEATFGFPPFHVERVVTAFCEKQLAASAVALDPSRHDEVQRRYRFWQCQKHQNRNSQV